MLREINHMLAGTAAGLHDIPGFAGKEAFQYRPDCLMVTVECRCVETTVGFDPAAVLAEFHDKFSHEILLGFADGQGLPNLSRARTNQPQKLTALDCSETVSSLADGVYPMASYIFKEISDISLPEACRRSAPASRDQG
jgi:hypothetical protein